MTVFSETLVAGYTMLTGRAAPDQGGLLSGKDPTAVNLADPLRLWIIQLGIIMFTTQLLSLALRKLHQPRVIAEVLGGILLGPTAFGRIPGFTQHVFPKDSIPFLSLVANIGLILFLFIVGLEIEGSVIKRNARMSACVSLGGMILPFGMGTGLSVAIYHHFVDPSTEFTHFMLFVGVAFSITAFPVLCRILTELKLLDTTVGIIVLSAGVGNDLVGWTLLALSVALVNAASGLTAVYILLTCLGFVFFTLFLMRPAVGWLARRTGSIEHGPSMFFMTVVMIVVFGSAFFTDVIGVHAIFGGFLAGLTVPRENGLAIGMVEKLEDMVSIVFLPLYFTLSGLSTDLGLLNNGITWGFTIAIIVTAYTGKFGGCTLAARLAGFSWREAATVGTLMSCKGLVELIVLNVGLAAGILDTRVFSMFVLEALVLTFMTTPVVVMLYPPQYRTRAVASGVDFGGVRDDVPSKGGSDAGTGVGTEDADGWKARVTVVLDRSEHLPALMTAAQLFAPAPDAKHAPPVLDALRLIELSDRTSDVMKSSNADALLRTDALLAAFRTFAALAGAPASPTLALVPTDGLADSVAAHARTNGAQLVLVPWLPHTVPLAREHSSASANTPFDALFPAGAAEQAASSSALHAAFVRGVFAQSPADVALFVDRGRAGTGAGDARRTHIVLPFFGGPDDRLALALVVQLCAHPLVTAKVVRIAKVDGPARPEEVHLGDHHGLTATSQASGAPDTVYGAATTQTRLQSETADSVAWAHLAAARLPRITLTTLATPTPLRDAVRTAATERATLVLMGRARRLAAESHHAELRGILDEHGHVLGEVRKTMGDAATAFVVSDVAAGLLVVQAAAARPER